MKCQFSELTLFGATGEVVMLPTQTNENDILDIEMLNSLFGLDFALRNGTILT